MNKIKIKGRGKVEITRANGTKENTGWIGNTTTNASLAEISGLIGNTGSKTAFTYLAVGTDNTAPAATQTQLQSEITDTGLARASATVSQTTDSQTNDTLQLTYTWTATGSKTVEEAAAFNNASAGTMLGRFLTSSKSLTSGDEIKITYQVTFS